MSEDARKKGQEFAKWLQLRSAEERAEGNRHGREQAEADHTEFQAAFHAGKCFVCKDDLKSFDKDRPCVHWLLKPDGFTKWHFPEVVDSFSCMQIQAFLRWVASEEAFARNINDLSDEGTGKLIELTIRYKEYEWSISCRENDFLGHQTNSEDSKRPHYHFQMRYKRGAFIRFNDFHLPLSEQDVVTIEAMRAAPGHVFQRFSGAPGMSEVLNEDTLELLVKHGKTGGDEKEAHLNLDTIVIAEDGGTIKGEDIYNIIQEAKATGVTITSLLPKLKNASVSTIVTPGPGVVEQTPRSGRNRRAKQTLTPPPKE